MSDVEYLDDALAAALDGFELPGLDVDDEQDGAAEAKAVDAYVNSKVEEMLPNKAEYQQMSNLSKLLSDPILEQQAAAAAGDQERTEQPLNPIALHCSGRKVTFIVWHWMLALSTLWMRTKTGGSSTGMPPCPRCYHLRQQQQQRQQGQQQQEQRGGKKGQMQAEQGGSCCHWDPHLCGTVTSHKWNKPAQRVVGFGEEQYLVVYQYKCDNCPAAEPNAKTGKRASFFLANDPQLLDIMNQQGLQWATGQVPAVKEDRLGMDIKLLDFAEHAIIGGGSFKELCDALRELAATAYVRRIQACVAWGASMQVLGSLPVARRQQAGPTPATATATAAGGAAAAGAAAGAAASGASNTAAARTAAPPRAGGQRSILAMFQPRSRQQQQQQQPQERDQTTPVAGQDAAHAAAASMATPAAAAAQAPAAQAAAAAASVAAPAAAQAPAVQAPAAAPAAARAQAAQAAAAAPPTVLNAGTSGTSQAVAGGKLAGFYPDQQQTPRSYPSQGFLQKMLLLRWKRRSHYARSLIHSATGKWVAADFQFYPTKMVKVNKDKAAAAIFNMVDTQTGALLLHVWTQSLQLEDIEHVLQEFVNNQTANNNPLPEVVYVDDPRMFQLLGRMFPNARLVQDAFHFIDRLSRAIPATNTMKEAFIGEVTSLVFEECAADVAACEAALRARGEELSKKPKQWRRKRIRRRIKAGDLIAAGLRQLVEKYKGMVCPVLLESVVTPELEAAVASALHPFNTKQGMKRPVDLLQDQLDMGDIYTHYSTDDMGLPLYYCHHGTSAEEGMHGHINKLFKGGNYGLDLAQAMLEQWVFRWNLMCLLKSNKDLSSYGTLHLYLLEEVQQAAAAGNYGKNPFPLWKPIKLLPEEQLPSFGLLVAPKAMLSDAADNLGPDAVEAVECSEDEDMELDEDDVPPSHNLQDMPWDGSLGLQPGRKLLCKRCQKMVPIQLRSPTEAQCSICQELVFDVAAEAAAMDVDMGAAGEDVGGAEEDMDTAGAAAQEAAAGAAAEEAAVGAAAEEAAADAAGGTSIASHGSDAAAATLAGQAPGSPAAPQQKRRKVRMGLFPSRHTGGTQAASYGLATAAAGVAAAGAAAAAAAAGVGAEQAAATAGSSPSRWTPQKALTKVRDAFSSLSPFKKKPSKQQSSTPVQPSGTAVQGPHTAGALPAAGSEAVGAAGGSAAAAPAVAVQLAAAQSSGQAAATAAAAGRDSGPPSSSTGAAAAAATTLGAAAGPSAGQLSSSSGVAAQWAALMQGRGRQQQQQQQQQQSVEVAGPQGVIIGGVQYPPGCPIQILDRKGMPRSISTCRECGMPRRIPDPSIPGQLMQTTAHHEFCSRHHGTRSYTYQTGKKAGQVAACGDYKAQQ